MATLLVPSNSSLTRSMKQKTYEPCSLQLCSDYLRKGDVAIDVGANIGFFSIGFADCVGLRGKVLSFEPHPELFSCLEENFRMNDRHNHSLFNHCVGGYEREENLYLNQTANTGDHCVWKHDGWPSIKTQVKTLDSVCEEENINSANLIKIDVQGMETECLVGAKNLLKNSQNIALVLEFCPYDLKKCKSSAVELASLLYQLGFRVYQIQESQMKINRIAFKRQLIDMIDPATENLINLWCVR